MLRSSVCFYMLLNLICSDSRIRSYWELKNENDIYISTVNTKKKLNSSSNFSVTLFQLWNNIEIYCSTFAKNESKYTPVHNVTPQLYQQFLGLEFLHYTHITLLLILNPNLKKFFKANIVIKSLSITVMYTDLCAYLPEQVVAAAASCSTGTLNAGILEHFCWKTWNSKLAMAQKFVR